MSKVRRHKPNAASKKPEGLKVVKTKTDTLLRKEAQKERLFLNKSKTDWSKQSRGIEKYLPKYHDIAPDGSQTVTISGLNCYIPPPPPHEDFLNAHIDDPKKQKWSKKLRTVISPPNIEELTKRGYKDPYDDDAWETLNYYGEREYLRIRNGVWLYINGVPTYLPGSYYDYLVYWSNKEKIDIEYIDTDREDYLHWETCIKHPKIRGRFCIERRQTGKSLKGGHRSFFVAFNTKGADTGLQSYNDPSAKTTFQQCIVDRITKRPIMMTPTMKDRNEITGEIKNASRIEFKFPKAADRVTESMNQIGTLGGVMDYKDAQVKSYDGRTLAYYWEDEAGKVSLNDVNLVERFNVVYQCAKFMERTTTIEDAGGGALDYLREFWGECEFHQDPDDHEYLTPRGIVQYFCPAVRGYINRYSTPKISFVDEFGNSDMTGALEYHLRSRETFLKKKDTTGLLSIIRKNAFTPDEAFQPNPTDCVFHILNLSTRKNELEKVYTKGRYNDDYGQPVAMPYRLDWEDGQFSSIIATPDYEGRFLISRHPEVEKRNRVITTKEERYSKVRKRYEVKNVYTPLNADSFVIGIDPYNYGKDTMNVGSKGGISVFWKDMEDNPDSGRFVAAYNYRPEKEEFFDDAIKLLWYYGAKAVIEKNMHSLLDHFERESAMGFVHRSLLMPNQKFSLKKAAEFGETTGNHNDLIYYTDLLGAFINSTPNKIDFLLFIDQAFRWRIDGKKTTGNLDYLLSCALALKGAKHQPIVEARVNTGGSALEAWVSQYS